MEGILDGRNSTFAKGIKPKNYVGIFGMLGGTPDFGMPSDFVKVGKRDRLEGEMGNLRMRRAVERAKRAARMGRRS